MGSLTIIIAGLSALFELDIKKIVALSTLSQLGLLMTRIGAGLWRPAFVHLLAHAFFKALLFIRIGQTLHLSSDYQDLRRVRSKRLASITLGVAGLCNARLAGFPFLAGFYSKDLIIESTFQQRNFFILSTRLLLGAFLTIAYSVRLTCCT